VYPDFVARKWFSGELYPGHAFGQAGFVSPAEYQGLRREDVQSFMSSLYRPDNGVAVVYGGVTLQEVKIASERYLADWRGGAGGAALSTPTAPPGPTERKIHLVDRPKATQAVVSIGCRLETVRPERLPAYDVLGGVIDESAWALREQWGATYGIHADVSKHGDGSAHLMLGGAIENAQAAKSIARLLQVVGAVGAGTIAEPLLLTKRWDVGREFMVRFATASSIAQAILQARLSGWPLEVWDKYPERLAATTRESLKEIMGTCVGKEIVAIVGDATVLRPQLEAEGLKVSVN
jgi:zinc protease